MSPERLLPARGSVGPAVLSYCQESPRCPTSSTSGSLQQLQPRVQPPEPALKAPSKGALRELKN